MSILEIELTPEMARRLAEKAKQRGLETKAYAQSVMLRDLLAEDAPKLESGKQHSVMELYGAGREDWIGIDVQQYINEMRDEWNR